MRTIKPTEDQIQKAVFEWIRHTAYEPYIFHIPNEGPRTPRYGAKMKAMGLKRGVSDIFIAFPSNGYHGMFIELKREGGKLTPHQKDFLELMADAGYATAVCYGVYETVKAIEDYFKA